MAIENRNYTNVSTVIQNAITAFNNIESTLSAMGAKTPSNGDINSTANYLSAADLRTIIQNQLQLKASGTKTITSKTSTELNNLTTGTYTSAKYWTVQDAVLGSASTATTANTVLSDGNGAVHENANDGSKYYTLSLTQLATTIPVTTSGWYAGSTVTTPLTFNIGAATFTYNAASGTVTCTGSGYIAQSNTSITSLTSAQLTVGSSISSLTGTPIEATDPAAAELSNYYAITATPTDNLSGFRAGVFTNVNEITRNAGTATTKYVKKGSVTSAATESSNTFSLLPGQTASVSKGYHATAKTIQVTTSGADVTADYMILGKKGYGANNTLYTGTIQPYDSTYTINLNNQTGAVSYANGKVTINGTIPNAGYYSGSKISGSINIPTGSVTLNNPTVTTTSGGSSANIFTENSGSTYKISITPSYTSTAGLIGAATNSAGTTVDYYIPKKGASAITVSGLDLSAGSGSVNMVAPASGNVNAGIFSTTSITNGYHVDIQGSGSVTRSAVTVSCEAGYYPALSGQSKASSSTVSSNTATKTIYIKKGSVEAGVTQNIPTITADSGDYTGTTHNTANDTLNISTKQPSSGSYYKLTASATASAKFNNSSEGYIKAADFGLGSNATQTQNYYIPKATFAYNNTANQAGRFIECKTAGYYPSGVLTIVDDSSITTDDIDYASVLASVSTSGTNIILTSSSAVSSNTGYELSISKGSVNAGYMSDTGGSIGLNTHYYIAKGSVSSSVKTLTSSVSSSTMNLYTASQKDSSKTYHTLTPSATAATQMSFGAGYIASKGTEGSTTSAGTAAYVLAAQYSVSGGQLTAGNGVAEFTPTKLMTGSTESTPTEILLSETTGLTNYYKINISGSGKVSKTAATFSVTEGYTSGWSGISVANAQNNFSSGTATATKYIPQSSTSSATVPSGITATNLAYGSTLKVSAGYYPSDRYITSTATAAAVNPTVGAITVAKIGSSDSTYTFSQSISGTMNVNIGTAGYLSSSVGTITQKNLSEFNSGKVTIAVSKGVVSGAGVTWPNNTTSTTSADKGYAKRASDSLTSGYVRVSARRAAASVTEGYVKSGDVSISQTDYDIKIAAASGVSITNNAITANGSGTVFGVTTFNDTDGTVNTAGSASNKTFSVSGSNSKTVSTYADKYIIGDVTVTGSASGTATATLNADASGTNVDNAVSQLYKCLLGKDYTSV